MRAKSFPRSSESVTDPECTPRSLPSPFRSRPMRIGPCARMTRWIFAARAASSARPARRAAPALFSRAASKRGRPWRNPYRGLFPRRSHRVPRRHFPDQPEDLLKRERWAELSARNLIASIEARRAPPLDPLAVRPGAFAMSARSTPAILPAALARWTRFAIPPSAPARRKGLCELQVDRGGRAGGRPGGRRFLRRAA